MWEERLGGLRLARLLVQRGLVSVGWGLMNCTLLVWCVGLMGSSAACLEAALTRSTQHVCMCGGPAGLHRRSEQPAHALIDERSSPKIVQVDTAFGEDMIAACQRLLEDPEVRVRWAVSAVRRAFGGLFVGMRGLGIATAARPPLARQQMQLTELQVPAVPPSVCTCPACSPSCCNALPCPLPLQVGELLRALCQQLGIAVWEQMQVGTVFQ